MGIVTSLLRDQFDVLEVFMELVDDEAATFSVKIEDDIMGGLVEIVVVN